MTDFRVAHNTHHGITHLTQRQTRHISTAIPVVIAIAVTALLAIGWINRDNDYLTPKTGLGYWLGILGAAAMLSLLIYSLRKRNKTMRFLGSIPLWFRIHMMLGIVGPVLIVFHSNFKFGSFNSNVAFIAMLAVACSGLVGRFLYRRIHMGLYGRKAEVREILAQVEALRHSLGHEMEAANYVADQLNSFSRQIMQNFPTGVLASFWLGTRLSVQTYFMQSRLLSEAKRLIRKEGKARRWSLRQRRERLALIRDVTRAYFSTVLKASELIFFERMFALWHIFHLPLFVIMVTAAVVHVWAVHHY